MLNDLWGPITDRVISPEDITTIRNSILIENPTKSLEDVLCTFEGYFSRNQEYPVSLQEELREAIFEVFDLYTGTNDVILQMAAVFRANRQNSKYRKN